MERIIKAINYVLEFLTAAQLNAGTVGNYRSFYRTISAFCESNSIDQFGDSEAGLFIQNQMQRHEKGEIGQIYFRHLRKAAVLLKNHMQGKELSWTKDVYHVKKLSKCFEDILAGYNEYLVKTLAVGTCRNAVSVARQFLVFLENNGVYDFNALTVDDVKKFMINMAPKYRNTMTSLTLYTKKFLSFLTAKGLANINADRYLANPAPPHKKVLPCFTDEEVAAIFSSVDTETLIGKRDYAIIKLAIRTGLRSVDILGLKMKDINWRKKEIIICQDKTDVYNTLPLLPDVGNAIMDYILNGRPNVRNPHIFLRTNAPYDRLKAGSSIGNRIIQRYLEKSSITHVAYDGKTFHALRRTTGTMLVRSGESLESVRQIMGSKHRNSLKPYIALDLDGLRICCLGLSQYATRKECLL